MEKRTLKIAGYKRCSTAHQSTEDQDHRIRTWGERAGHELVEMFEDFGTSGAKAKRPGLDALLAAAKDHQVDAIVITKYSRLFRSTKHLLDVVAELDHLGVALISIDNQMDTSSPQGRFFLTVIAGFDEMERDLIRERVREGLAKAKRNGVQLGNKGLAAEKVEEIRELLEDPDVLPITEISKRAGVSRPTVYKVKAAWEAELLEA